MFYENLIRHKLSVHMIYEPLKMLLQLYNLPNFILRALFTPQKPHYKSTNYDKKLIII